MSNGTQRQKYSNLNAERVNVEKKLLDLLKQYYASVGGGWAYLPQNRRQKSPAPTYCIYLNKGHVSPDFWHLFLKNKTTSPGPQKPV